MLEQRGLEELLDRVPDDPAPRVPQHEARPDLLLDRVVQVELLAQDAVVTPLRLREPLQVALELGLPSEGRPVDALQHLALLVASPVRARPGEQLEVLEAPRARHVRPLAQVEERPVPVDRDHLVVVELLEPLELERVVAEELARLLLVDAAALEGLIGGHDLRHLGLEGLEVLGREGLADVEVVVEAVVDGRPEADPGARAQLAHGGRQHVRGRVPEHGQGLGILLREDAQPRVGEERLHQPDRLVVGDGRERGLGEARPDRRGDVTRRGAGLHLEDVPVG